MTKTQSYGDFEVNDCQCGYNPVTDYLDNLYYCNREKTEFNICCKFHNGGCGRTVYGKTIKEAVERWNKGINDETIY